MIEFKDLADYCQALALANKLHPTDEAIYRSFCRQYSRSFHTPLHQVLDLDPIVVMTAIYEDQLEEISLDDNMEQIMDLIYQLEDPEYAQQKRDELKQFIKDSEEEEEERIEMGKPIHRALADENEVSLKKDTSEVPPTPNKKLPQGGGINLSYLEREENGSNEEF